MNRKTALKGTLALLATTVLLNPTVTLANSYVDAIANQLARAARIVGLEGYNFSDVDAGQMNPRSVEYLTVNLRSGVDYKLISVCDQDCSDVDLWLYDGNGNLIDSDVAADDIPLVGVTPRWSGKFTIKVSMASCSARYCYYGIGLFDR